MNGLTKRQREIVDYIQTFIQSNRYSPSFREIMSEFGFTSIASVSKHIHALKKKGILTQAKQSGRSLALIETFKEPAAKRTDCTIPLIGSLQGGYPIEMFSNPEAISIPDMSLLHPDKTYLLRIKGDNLQEEMMFDGDIVIIEAASEALPGETVLALINQHDTIIKQYYQEGGYVRLASRNPHYHPLIFREEDVLIQAIIKGLYRSFTL